MMKMQIMNRSFEPYSELLAYQQSLGAGQFGATCVFVGTMRDFNDGDTVTSMYLEHYAEMTEKYLLNIMALAAQKWAVQDALLLHRVGDILPNEAIVLIAVWSAHRGDAFDACRFMIEELKKSAPFWKKELLSSQKARWIEHNSDGYLQEE